LVENPNRSDRLLIANITYFSQPSSVTFMKYYSMKYYNRHIVFWSLLLGTLGLIIFLGWGVINPLVALAAIQQLEEAPSQMVYR